MSSSYSTPFIFLFIFLLFFSTTITSTHSARILLDVVAGPPQSPHHHPTQPPSITFIMQDILPKTNIINPQQQQQQQQLPFAKPLRTFPLTYGGIPLPHQKNPNKQNSPTQTFEIPKFGIAFATTSKDLQQEMEFGLVTTIEEEIYDENSVFGPTMTLMGVSRGVYVAMNSSSQDDNDDDDHNSHMMAMTVTLSNDINDDDDDDEVDRLKLFGVHRRDVLECHVAVIGGTGKFKDANGFAVIKVLSTNKLGFSDVEGELSDEKANNNMMLLYNVYLS